MKFTRRPTVLAVWAVVVVAAIITTVFACSLGGGKGGNSVGGTVDPPKNPYACTVTFDMGGGMIDGNYSYKVEVEKNSTVKRPTEIPYREGYVFWGWNTTGDEYDPMWKFDVQNVTQDITIYATWKIECPVTFYAEGGAFEDGTDAYTYTIAYGDKLTAPKVTPPDEATELTYWETEGGGRWDFSEPTIGYVGIELYAHWDTKRDIQLALEPFMYNKKFDGGYNIYGVVDQNVSGTLTVPSIVTSIDFAAFVNCPNIDSIVIDDSVTDIAHYAFQNCKSLKSVTLPSGLTSIKSHTFDGCSSLEQINLPDTLTEIGDSAFKGCTSLEQVKLTDNVTRIGYHAFSGCSSLADIQISASVEQLDDYAFEGCLSLKSITIPATCQYIGMDAFKNCTGITSAELHCETVGPLAFADCTALASVTLGSEVHTIRDSAFSDCSNLRSVTIGDGVTEIPYRAFSNCVNLRSVTIGSGVKEIENRAFECCISLLSITIPSNVETIGVSAFTGCQKLVEVYNLSGAEYSFSSTVTVHTDADEDSIIHTTADGFSFCITKDENVYPYAQTLFLIGYSGDKSDIVLPDSYNGESYKVYKYALAYNDKLKSVKFSAGVTEIKGEVLYGSDNVTSLTVDSGNTEYHAAGNCVINTADKKFILGCKTSVIPTDGSVTSIGIYVFCGNSKISSETFKIPDVVTQVERYAFSECAQLMRTVDNIVYVDNWAIALGNYDLNSNEKLDLQFQSGTVGIAECAFWNYNFIRSVTFNDEMRYVCMDAFSNCGELTTVNFNDGLVSIESSAFYKCKKLQEVVLPDSVTTLGWGAFIYSDALTYVKLPAALASANTQIFDGCRALETVVIPQAVKVIGYTMFRSCPDTVKIYYGGTEEEWNTIEIRNDNDPLINGTKYFYSETEIEGVNCWHYGDDGKPTTEY